MSDTLPTREQELDLHRQLVEGDPVAPSRLARILLPLLIDFLRQRNDRSISQVLIDEAAGLAIALLAKSPTKFDPDRAKGDHPLFSYLKMSSQGDLQNALKSEERHRGHVRLDDVEQSPDAGKYLGISDDPSILLENREEADQANQQILTPVRDGLTEDEIGCLELMMLGERKTSAYVRLMKMEHLPKDQQQLEVKRLKDRLKNRIERRDHG